MSHHVDHGAQTGAWIVESLIQSMFHGTCSNWSCLQSWRMMPRKEIGQMNLVCQARKFKSLQRTSIMLRSGCRQTVTFHLQIKKILPNLNCPEYLYAATTVQFGICAFDQQLKAVASLKARFMRLQNAKKINCRMIPRGKIQYLTLHSRTAPTTMTWLLSGSLWSIVWTFTKKHIVCKYDTHRARV